MYAEPQEIESHFFFLIVYYYCCVLTGLENISKRRRKSEKRDWFVSIKIRRYLSLLVYTSYCALCCFSFYSTRLGSKRAGLHVLFSIVYNPPKISIVTRRESLSLTNCSWSWLALENTRNGGREREYLNVIWFPVQSSPFFARFIWLPW